MVGRRRQLDQEDLRLHLRRKDEKVHELGDAGARDGELAGHVGEVAKSRRSSRLRRACAETSWLATRAG